MTNIKQSSKIRWLIVFSLLSTLPVFQTCTKKESDVIKIGVITPLSGEGATYGESTKRGVDLAVKELNESGGIMDKKIKIIYEDSQINPEEGTKAIQKLISIEKVPVILGAFGSSVSLAIAPLAERANVVLFSASSTADALKDAGDFFFRNVPTNSAQGASAATFALEKLNAQSAAIFMMNNDYGISLAQSFESYFRDAGGSILLTDNYNPGDRDFRTQLSKIKEENPDIIFYPGQYQESGLILIQAKELGITSTFIGGDGSYSPELVSIAGSASEGSYYTLMALGYGVSDDLIEDFEKAFEYEYGTKPNVYSAYAYEALRIISGAIKLGGYTSEGIKKALYETNDFRGITGITSFDEFGEVDKPFYVYEVKDGEFRIIKLEE